MIRVLGENNKKRQQLAEVEKDAAALIPEPKGFKKKNPTGVHKTDTVQKRGCKKGSSYTTKDMWDRVKSVHHLMGRGLTEFEIRERLKMNRRQFHYCIARIRRLAINPADIWMQFLAGQQQDLKRFDQLMIEAMQGRDERTAAEREAGAPLKLTKPDPRLATVIGLARAKVRKETVQIGQSLGVYKRVPDELLVNHADESFKQMFNDRAFDVADDELPSGNVYGSDGKPKSLAAPDVTDAEFETVEGNGAAYSNGDAG